MLYYFVSFMAINTVIYDIYYSMILYMHYEGTYVVSYTSIICMILYIYSIWYSPLYKAGHSGGIIADDIMHSEIASIYADVAKNKYIYKEG